MKEAAEEMETKTWSKEARRSQEEGGIQNGWGGKKPCEKNKADHGEEEHGSTHSGTLGACEFLEMARA